MCPGLHRRTAGAYSGDMVQRIISGGQTGVDRAALDAAIACGIPHGGWCPRGRLAEDGRIPDRYNLQETPGAAYAERTLKNVVEADATLILHRGPISGGTWLTVQFAHKHKKPLCVVSLAEPPAAGQVLAWLHEHQVQTLNVAGPRESTEPGIYQDAYLFLHRLFQTILASSRSSSA
ncbi:MAG: hypothetical protein KatS3mg110_0913 [Pirellulaceae bacterium]|nr:MAG: hypothetical protein KatS3mg110_0913 [Pirellulaceae bacterium]